MEERLVTIAVFPTLATADAALNLLRHEGLDGWLDGEASAAWLGQTTGGVRLRVAAENVEWARAILGDAHHGGRRVSDAQLADVEWEQVEIDEPLPFALPSRADEEDDWPDDAGRELLHAAVNAALAGLFLPPLTLWSLLLLARLRPASTGRRHCRDGRLWTALAVNLAVLAAWSLALWLAVRAAL